MAENGSLDELLKEMKRATKPNKELDPELLKALSELTDATQEQIKDAKKAERDGKITERQQEQTTKALQKNLLELQESVKLAAITQKDATKAIEESTKIAKKNLDAQKKALAQNRNVGNVPHQRVLFGGQGRAGAKNFFTGTGRVGTAGRALGGVAKEEALDSVRGFAGKSAAGGRLAALGGPVALIAGALAALVGTALEKRLRGLEASMLRTANYGTGEGGSVDDEATAANEAMDRARRSSIAYNQDAEAMQAAVQKIGAAGTEWSKIDEGITNQIGRMAQLGIDTVDGITDAAIQRSRDTGATIAQAFKEIANESDFVLGSGVEYGTLTHALQEMEGANKTLNRSTAGLVKTFSKSNAVATKLGLSYNRMVNASMGVTQKAGQFEEGFSILRQDRDLALALQDAQKRVDLNSEDKDAAAQLRDLKQLQQLMRDDQIDRQSSAQYLNELGVGKTEAVINDRMMELGRLLNEGGRAGVAQANARVGTPLTFDEQNVLRNFQKGIELSPADKETFNKIKKEQEETAAKMAEQQVGKSIEAYLEELLTAVTDVLIPALNTIRDGINFVSDTFAQIRAKGFMNWAQGPSKQERMDELFFEGSKSGLLNNMYSMMNADEKKQNPLEQIRNLQRDDRLSQIRVDTDEQRRNLEKLVDPMTALVLRRATVLEDKKGTKDEVAVAKTEAAALRKVVADADAKVTADGSIIFKIPANVLNAQNGVTTATKNSVKPVGG